jgi:TonB family protein
VDLFGKSLALSVSIHLAAAGMLISGDVILIKLDMASGLSSLSVSLNSGAGGGAGNGGMADWEQVVLEETEMEGDVRVQRRTKGGGSENMGERQSMAMNGVLSDRASANSRNYPPAYPYMARRMGVQGRVILSIEVRTDGRAGNVSVMKSSGDRLLDESALEAARRWIFFSEGEMKLEAPVILRQEIVFALEK